MLRNRTFTLPLSLCLLLASPIAAADRLADLRSALREAGRANSSQWRAIEARHGTDPLWPWLEYARLRHRRDHFDADEVGAALPADPAAPGALAIRRLALETFGKRGDLASVRRFDAADARAGDVALSCYALQAQLAVNREPAIVDASLALWDRGEPLPNSCDGLIAQLQTLGKIDTARRLGRIEAAAARGESGLMRHLARALDSSLRAKIEAEADFIERPHLGAAAWEGSPRTRAAIESGLEQLARRDPDAAERLLDALETPLSLELQRRGRLRASIALWSAANYLPQTADRFVRVPADAFDERLHEWRAREALARRNRGQVLAAIEAMPLSLRESSRWRLLQARLRAADAPEVARSLLQSIASEASFHGFLAADLLGLDYPLCPLAPPDGPEMRARVLALPGLARALDLFSLDRLGWAMREWAAVVPDLSLDEQAVAVELAAERGWYERAAQTLGSGVGMRYYGQRFPLPHASTLRRESRRHGLAASWVAALVRAESAWMPSARSHADARGLMQLLPTTGRAVAKRRGLPWSGPGALFHADTNLVLGSDYLKQMLDAHDGRPYLATAAYNAGPAAVQRWLSERPPNAPLLDDPLLWLETMPFHETRDYVARVMAFSVIYDWRLEKRAGSLLARMQGRDAGKPRGFACASAAVE
jgi:soluble lytic murein transglycosylase